MRSEFDFIQNIKNKYNLTFVGDDCAVLPKDDKTDMVLTVDMLVEDVDFRLDWTTPEFLGHKALAVSLSDIAAMGAGPKWAMLSIGVPEKIWKTDFIDRFYAGWFALAKQFDVELIGGDVSRSPDKVVIDSISGGDVPKGKAILRSTAKPGERIFVTGTLGAAACGLKLLESGERYNESLAASMQDPILRQLQPQSKIGVANSLQSLNIATSMIDISDGLASDLKHICKASGVGARLFAEKIPADPNLAMMSSDQILDFAINGGEDFELLFTTNEKNISSLKTPDFSCIGEITASIGIIELILDGNSEILIPKGFRHF